MDDEVFPSVALACGWKATQTQSDAGPQVPQAVCVAVRAPHSSGPRAGDKVPAHRHLWQVAQSPGAGLGEGKFGAGAGEDAAG